MVPHCNSDDSLLIQGIGLTGEKLGGGKERKGKGREGNKEETLITLRGRRRMMMAVCWGKGSRGDWQQQIEKHSVAIKVELSGISLKLNLYM